MFSWKFASGGPSPARVPHAYEDSLILRKVHCDGRHRPLASSDEITSVAFDEISSKVVVRAPVGNPVPLFWGWSSDSALILSDSVPGVLKAIGAEMNSAPDRVAMVEAMLFDSPLADRTFHEAVKKLRGGEELTFCLVSKKARSRWFWLPALHNRIVKDEREVQKEAARHIESLAPDARNLDSRILLPLTGGLDSRLLATQAVQQGLSPYTYTFRRGWSVESWYAKKVAKALDIEHTNLDLGISCFREFARDVALRTGGMVTGMHTHGIYCCDSLIPAELKSAPRFFGYFGGQFAGESTASKETAALANTPEGILAQAGTTLYPELVEAYAPEILADIASCYDAFQQSGSKEDAFYDFWRICERQCGLITHLFNFHRAHHNVRVIEPFLKKEPLDFFLSLPWKYRYNRTFFKQLVKELYPRTFSLPTMHFAADSGMAKLERAFERAESLANRLCAKQEVLLSPFKYEQHEKNLQNHLVKDIAAGMERTAEIFSIDRKVPRFPVWRHSSMREYYRLASFGYMFEPTQEMNGSVREEAEQVKGYSFSTPTAL